MKSKKLVDAFGYIEDAYLELVETERTRRKGRMPFGPGAGKRPLWFYGSTIAACLACGIVILSAGVMAADLFGLRSLLIGKPDAGGAPDQYSLIGEPIQGGESSVTAPDSLDIISLSGYFDSPETRALEEWEEYLRGYDPDGSILRANDKEVFTIEGQESQYGVYSREMVEKLCEIKDKYGLKLHTDLDLVSPKELAYRVGGTFWDERMVPATGYIYENGTFQFDGDWYQDGVDIALQFRRVVKGTFEEVLLNIGQIDEYEEWQYITGCGEPVMLALGPGKGLLFADLDSSFISVNVLWGSENGLTREQLQELADSLDFTLLREVQVPDMRGDIVLLEDEERVFGEADETRKTGDPLMDGSKPEPASGRYGAYYDILFNLRYNFLWPDHEMTMARDWEEGCPQDNVFAIADVNADGLDELVIAIQNTSMAGMRCSVYGYEDATRECYEMLTEYPGVTFYDTGIVTVPLSHNHGPVCDSLWPYSVYRYNENTGKYDLVATVFGYDKQLALEYGMEDYPQEADAENYGTVYYLLQDGETFDHPVSHSFYEAWKEELTGDAGIIRPDYQVMDGWNILGVNREE